MSSRNEPIRNAVFLDRDGVINRDSKHYVKTLSEFEFLPGSLGAIARLTAQGRALFVVTNQSAVNRGIITAPVLESIHDMMLREISSHGGGIKEIFHCPHSPQDACACRKPKPGLILKARDRHHIDLASSCMVGDNLTDIACARNAGCGSAILVRTGRGAEMEKKLGPKTVLPDIIADDLSEAADWILRSTG